MRVLCSFLACVAVLASMATAQVPNNNPSFASGASTIQVVEDSGTHDQPWATAVSDGEAAGGADSGLQTTTFTVVPADRSLFSVQPAITSPGGRLSFTPAPNAFGSTTAVITLRDSGTATCVVGNGPGGRAIAACPSGCSPTDCSVSRAVTITIIISPVNDCPTFTIRGDQTVLEDSGQAQVVGFAYQISRGAPNENAQTLTFALSAADTSLFAVQPAIAWAATNPTGSDLTFTPAANVHGSTQVSVQATDNGGTNNNGCEQSTTQTFTITITPVNDAPSFIMGTSPQVVLEDSGATNVPGWASGMSPGPANEAGQSVSFNLQYRDPTVASLFSVQPSINPNTGDLSFTVADNANTFARTVQMYVQLQDNTGSGTATDYSCYPITACPILTIQITPNNDAPSFQPGGNIRVYEDLLNYAVAPVPPIYTDGNAWATNLNVGATNEGLGASNEGQEVGFRLTNNNVDLFDVQPAIDGRGTLTFQLKPDASGIATVDATIFDTGNPPMDGNTAQFTITVEEVNDAPSFTIFHPNPLVINEDIGDVDIAVWATNVVAGPVLHENTQINRFILEPVDTSFFAIQPTVTLTSSGTGRLQFRTGPNVWGTTTVRVTLQDDGGVVRKGVDAHSQDLTIIVNSINDPPTFQLADTVITQYEAEIPSAYSRSGFAYNISAGGWTEGNNGASVNTQQQVRFTCTLDNHHLFTILPKVSSTGLLTFTPAPNMNGDAIVTVIAQDDNMPPATSIARTVTIRLLPVNNAPTFTHGGDITGRQITMCQTQGACTRTFTNYIKDIKAGPDVSEANQQVTLAASVPPAFQSLFVGGITITPNGGDLQFTLALNRYTEVGNPVPVTITATDDGGTTNGGSDTTIQVIKLEIQKQDSPPQFNAGPDVTVNEDSGDHRSPAWASGIQVGPLDTTTQGLSFRLKVADPTMFSSQPTITLDAGNTGTLTFTPQVNRFGVCLVQVTLDNALNTQSSDQFTFTITITPVNDAPVFTAVGNMVSYESSGVHVSQWVNSLSPGPYENAQTTDWSISCDAVATNLFATAPDVNNQGEITWTLANAQSGLTSCVATVTDSGDILNGGINSANLRFSIDVKAINDAPSFTAGADITLDEGAGAHTALNWASSMNAGAGDNGQILTFVATTTNDAMFTVPVRIDSTSGTMTFTLADGANGNVYVDILLQDNGGTTPADKNKSPVHRMLLVVRPVNSAPTFTLGSNIAVLENSGLYSQKAWATGITAGPINEVHQSLRFTLTASNTDLFALPPSIDPATGDLQFSLKSDANGATAVEVCLQDNGGTLRSGVDKTCIANQMTISIAAVNGAPEAVIPATVTVLEDAGAFNMDNFLTGVSPGAANEVNQLITSVTVTIPSASKAYFTTQPTISLSNYALSFQTAADFFGTVSATVTIVDNGGVNNGGVNTKTGTFDIVVLPVNDRPSFTKGPNVNILEDASAWSSLWAGSIVAGPTNEAAQTVVFSCTNNMNAGFTKQPAIDTRGYLTFTAAPNANGVVTVTVYLKDNGGVTNNGLDTSIDGVTFTITIAAVNDKPFFNPGPAVLLDEDSKTFFYKSWATGIVAGPDVGEQIAQRNLTFTVIPTDTSYFSVQPTVEYPSGDLSFGLTDNRFGVTTFRVELSDNVAPAPATYSRVVTMTVNAVNDAPTFSTSGDVTVLEDAGDQVIANFIKSSSAGPFEDSQSVAFNVVPSDVKLFASPPRIVGTSLLFTTAANANGVSSFVVNASDRSGAKNHWYAKTFNMNILPVNDPPEFTVGADITVSESSGTTKINNWLKSKQVLPGPSDESAQLVTAYWTVTPTNVLAAEPLLDLTNNILTISVLPHRFGTVSVSVYYKDNGGTANKGDDTSDAQTFDINVNGINNVPTFVPGIPVIYVGKTTTSYSQPWASNVSAGIYEDGAQTVGFDVSVTNQFLFATKPAISPAGVMSFVLAPNAQGNTTMSVVLRDSAGAATETVYVTLCIASYTGPDLIILTVATPYEQFDQQQFRETISTALGINNDQVVIHNTQAGSTVVTFQLVGRSGGLTSEQLTSNLLALIHTNDAFRRRISYVQVNVVPNSYASSYTTSPAPTVPAASDDDEFNWVALGIVLVCVVLAIIVIIIVVVSYKKRQDKKVKQQPKFSPQTNYGSAPTQGPMQTNPVNDFNRQQQDPYDGGSPQLQRGKSQRWGNDASNTGGNAPVQ